MKHPTKIIFLLLGLFLVTQVFGLFTVNKYIGVVEGPDGSISISHGETIVGPAPEFKDEEKSFSFVPIIVAILVGTAFLFVLIRFKMHKVWKLWFFIALATTISISLGVYFAKWVAVLFGISFAAVRLLKKSLFFHNFTEIFVYTGLTIILLPFLNLFSGFFLLILISVYDMIAVWKSKHMIKLAKFQLQSEMFAGLSMDYLPKKIDISSGAKKSKRVAGKGKSNAILGGGDIAFPLIFSSAVMEHLIIVDGIMKTQAFLLSLLIGIGAAIALGLLLFFSKKGKFYPAMPFISMGCIAGFLIVLLF